jgi:polyisoprenoid-binding protein YceI
MMPHFLRRTSSWIGSRGLPTWPGIQPGCGTLAAALAVLAAVPTTRAATFRVAPHAASQVEFLSKAPMETFGGKTRSLEGSITLEPDSLGDSLQVVIEVDMASLDTGIELRNRHMRENHLHTDQYPKAIFRGGHLEDLSSARLATGVPVTGTLTGTMELHGTTRPLAVPFQMTSTGAALRVSCRFEISLADYGIPRPQFLVMRLDDIQRVTVELEARPR